MDPTTATLITGLAAASVGIGSAILSYLALRKQLVLQAENKKNERKHSIKKAAFPKVATALELSWAALHEIEVHSKITDMVIREVVASSVWLPSSVRTALYAALGKPDRLDLVKTAQNEIMQYINTLNEGTNE